MTRVLSAASCCPLLIAAVACSRLRGLAIAEIAALLAFREYGDVASALGANVPRVVAGAAVLAACAAAAIPGVPVDVVLHDRVRGCRRSRGCRGRPGPAVLARRRRRAAAGCLYRPAARRACGVPSHRWSHALILLLLIVMVVSDSAQYYTGRALGRRPLAPAISPKKTVEGAVGGMVFGTRP